MALAIINASTADGTVQFARIDGTDRLDLIGDFSIPIVEDLTEEGWDIRAVAPQTESGTTTANSVILTR